MPASCEDKINHSTEDRTLKDLSLNSAALLCYVAGWISGIVFLVLEQKNRFIRFHALQSIIVFGILSATGLVFGHIPFVGTGFSAIIGITGLVLWIILMIKAYSGETFKVPWAGDLAEKLTLQSMSSARSSTAGTGVDSEIAKEEVESTSTPTRLSLEESTVSTDPSSVRNSRREAFTAKYYSTGARTGRIVGSAFVIAFSLALIIFLNFFNQYIAYYESFSQGGITYWQVHPLVTSQFYSWLPIVNTALAFTIIGHAILIAFDKYLLRELVEIILTIFNLAAVVSLVAIFPFNFNVIPNDNAAYWVPIGLTITLIFISVGLGIGALVRFIQLIVHAAEGRY